MTVVRATLSGLAAIFAAWVVCLLPLLNLNNSKATGLAALIGSSVESLVSPLFWVLAISFFALFFFASRLANRPSRVLLFWMPTTAICTLGISIFTLFAYLLLHVS